MATGEWRKLIGTTLTKLQVGIGGLFLKVSSGKFRARNAADNADAPIVGSVIAASGNTIEINEDAAGSGADWLYTLARPASGMTAAVTLTLPVDDGSPSQVIQTDGSGALSWTTIASGNDKSVTDTTTLAFNSASPVAMFTLPANAVVEEVKVIIDTAFDDTPTMTVGKVGTTSKYSGTGDVDLTAVAETVFSVTPGLNAVGVTEALIITYAAASATAGSARVLVTYVIPS